MNPRRGASGTNAGCLEEVLGIPRTLEGGDPLQRFVARMRRLGAIALALALGPGCASPPRPIEYDSSRDQPATADGLYAVRASRLGAAFLKPGASFADYDGVLIDPVSVSYKRESRRPSRASFALDEASVERLKRIFQESFDRQLARSRAFAVASGAGPGVLRVSGHIVNLVVNVPPFRGGEVNFVLDAGEMTLILDVRDSETGEPLARVADRRLIRPSASSVVGGYQSNPVNTWGAVREIFTDWARILREGLDDLHTLTAPPLPEAAAGQAGPHGGAPKGER